MAQKPDFFVEFGDNAADWANSLKGPFRDVYGEIALLNSALKDLSKNTVGTGAALNKELSKTTGGNGARMLRDFDASADSLNQMVGDLQNMMTTLQQLPRKLKKMRRDLLNQETALIKQMTGDGGTVDPKSRKYNKDGTQTSQSLRFATQISTAVESGLKRGMKDLKPVIQQASVKGVSKEAIDRGAADRIIKAIEKQTKQLLKGGGGPPAPPANTVTAPGKGKKSSKEPAHIAEARAQVAAADAAGKTEKKKTTDLDRAEKALTRAKREHAAHATDETKKQLASAQKERDSLTSAALKQDRADRGITVAQQKKERQAKAKEERAARAASAPDLTKGEKASRREELGLISRAGARDLEARVGRGPGGDRVMMTELKRMADALTKHGFETPYNSRTRQAELAQLVSKSGQKFQKVNQGEVPESLRTDGKTVKVDEVSQNVKKMLGNVNKLVVEGERLLEASELLKASGLSGGQAPYTGDAPARTRRKIAKGAYTYGAAIGELGVPGYSESAGTRSEVDAARALLRDPALKGLTKRTMKLAQEPGFNPYAMDLSIKGNGPEATQARTAIAGMRAVTTEIDKVGKEFFQLADALKQTDKQIDEYTADIRKQQAALDSGKAKGKARLRAQDQIAGNYERISLLREDQDAVRATMAQMAQGPLGKLFRSPGYREGLQNREYGTDLYGYTDQAGRKLQAQYPGARELREGRVEQLRKTNDPSKADDLQMATMQAVAGIRTAIGSKQVIGNILGLSAVADPNRRNRTRLVAADASAADQRLLDQAVNRYSSVQTKIQSGKAKGTSDEIADRFENAAVRLAAVIDKLTGSSPAIETLTGSGIRQDVNLRGEQERQDRRDLAQDRLNKKIQKQYGPGQFLEERTENVQRSLGARSAAKKRQAEAADRLAKAETLQAAEEEALVKKLTASQQKRRRALQRQLAAAQKEEFRASSDVLSGQDLVNKVTTPKGVKWEPSKILTEGLGPGYLGADVSGPRTQAQTALDDLQGDAKKRLDRVLTAQVKQKEIQGKIDKYGTSDPRVTAGITAAKAGAKQAAKDLTDVNGALIRDVQLLKKVRKVLALAAEGAEALGVEPKQFRSKIAELSGLNKREVDQILRKKPLPGPTILDDADREADARKEQKRLQDRLAEILPVQTNKKGEALIDKQGRTTPMNTKAGIAALEKQAKAAEALVSGRAGGQLKSAVTRARNKGDVEGLFKAEQTLNERQSAAKVLRDLATEAKTAATRLSALHTELSPTLKKEKEAALAKEAETAATKEATAAINGDIAKKKGKGFSQTDEAVKLRAERLALQKVPHTTTERKAADAAGDKKLSSAIRERVLRLNDINARLKVLNAEELAARPPGSGGGGKGGKTTFAGGGGDDNIFRQMLNELKKINTALRGGVKTTGAAADGKSGTTARGVARATPEELRLLQSEDPADVKKAAELERARIEKAGPKAQEAAKVQTVKDLAKARTVASEKARQQARDEEVLARALRLVSDATKREIAELERLTKAGANASRITAQQRKVFTSISDDLQYSSAARGRDDVARSILGKTNPGMSRAEFTNIKRDASAEAGFTQIGAGWAEDTMDGFASHFGGRGFWQRILNTTGTFIVRNFAAGAVFGITSALQDVIQQAIQTEATFIRVSAALDATGQKVGSLRGDLQDVSTDYGVALNDVYNTAAGLTGLFDSAEDTAAATRIVAQLQAISGGALNAQEATGVLASTISAFGALPGESITDKLLPGGTEGFQKVADVLTVIQSNMGVNIETSAEGVSRMAGLARQMKISFEETAIFVAQIAKQTNQTGAAAGEQFSRIIGALQTGRGRAAVQDAYGTKIAAPLAEGDYGEVFKVMIAGYDGLSDATKRNLVVSVAGQRQAAAFNALMNNGAKTLNTLRKAEDANGEAADRMAKLVNTLNTQMAILQTNAQNLANELVRTGILNFLGVTLKALNSVLQLLNEVLNAFNTFADNNAFLNFLRKGITGLLGFAVAFKLIQASVRGLKGAITAAVPKDIRDARAARLAAREATPGVQRPGFGVYGSPNQVSRTSRIPVAAGAPGPVRIVSPDVLEARQRRAYLTRGIGYGLDRTVGVGLDGVARGMTAGAAKWTSAAATQNAASRGLARGSELLARGATLLAAGARGGFQGLGSGRFSPVGAAGRGVGNLGNRWTAAAAEQRAIFQSQQQFARLGSGSTAPPLQQALYRRGLSQQGLSAEQVALRTAAPDPRLARSAQQLERMGRVAGGTAAGLGRVSDGFARLNQTGGLMDGAMIGLAISIAAVVEGLRNQSEANKQLRADNKEFFAETDQAKKAAANPEYYGRNYASFQESYLPDIKDPLRDDGKLQQFQDGLKGLGAVFTQDSVVSLPNRLQGLLSGNIDPSRKALARAYGTEEDLSSTSGLDEAQKLQDMSDALLDRVEGTSKTGDDVREAQEKVQKKIDAEKIRVLQSDDSSRQKQAALANLEVVQRNLQERAANLAGIADGVDAAIGLTTSQIQSVQQYVGTLQSLNGGQGEFSTQLEGLREDTGVDPTSRAGEILKRMMNGDSTTIAIGNIGLLREQVKQLYQNWQTLLLSNGPDDAETQAAQQLFMSTLSQYGQANDQAIETLSQTTTEIATELSDTGDFKGAMDAYTQGMERMENVFQRQQREIRRGFNALKKTAHAARVAARQAITDAIEAGTTIPSNFAFPDVPKFNKKSKAEQARKHRRKMIEKLREQAAIALADAVREIDRQIAAAIDPAVIAALQALRASTEANFNKTLNSGKSPAGSGIKPGFAAEYGDPAVTEDQLATSQNAAVDAEQASIQAAADRASQARADAAALRQARLGVAAAWADARGDAVASAKVQVAMAKAAMAAARAELAAATTASARSQALVAIYSAQAQLISAVAAVQQAQMDLVQSQYDVTIALATAAGHTVQAATLTLQQARAALGAALKKSGGKATAEVNQARVAVINAEAAARDAKLQDELDTIDFNLQMGKITQSSAIKALQEILRTNELTKQQRRQLLLQIKGMKDELSNSQWNFGDIKLPSPYQMRRYIAERRKQFRGELEQAATGNTPTTRPPGSNEGTRPGADRGVVYANTTTITIDGADIGKIRQVIREVVGDSSAINTRTTGARRGGR